MDYSQCTDQYSPANPRLNDLSNDFMFGFDVEDDDDREYLAEVALRGIGREADIKGFVRLSLLRGMEEWEQAISCASAMKDRGSYHDSLDGQDMLTFLAKIYGVDGSCHTTGSLSPPQKPGRSRAKRTSKKTCVSLHPEIQLDVPVKKQRKVRNGKDSPYWDETSRQRASHSDNGPEAKVRAKKTLMKRKESLEGAVTSMSMAPIERPMVMRTCRVHELTPVSSDYQHESPKTVPLINTQGFTNEPGDEDANSALPKPDNPTTQVLDASEPNIEVTRTARSEDTGKINQASNDEGKPSPPPPPPASQKQTPKRKAKSPYFTTEKPAPSPPPPRSPNKRPPPGTISSLPFPRLDAPRFGLIQEELAHDPFRLLVAVTFLVRTTGRAAIPAFRALMDAYPTPAALAAADTADIVAAIRHLGLGSVRARTIQRYARAWAADPPREGVRYVVRKYDCAAEVGGPRHHGDEEGIIIRTGDSDAWEIGHLTQGPYALDSWRIFCRDVLRGVAADWNGAGARDGFQPEWMRVLPRDKELRACLRWMWMREGWLWDPRTGDKVVLPDDLRRAVRDGRVGYDDAGDLRILEATVEEAAG
ncbi:DNA glycosylase [Xylaria digitata]|nr:DNA glycosylase [Xylaria digitata]